MSRFNKPKNAFLRCTYRVFRFLCWRRKLQCWIVNALQKMTPRITLLLLLITSFACAERSTVHKLGDWGQYALPASALTLSAAKNDPIGVLQLGKATLLTMGTIYALKFSINTRRPDRGQYSFPSGHTGIAFASAAFIERRYGLRYGIPAYLAASFIGYSRIYARKHHTIDVVTAAGIAIAANYLFTTKYTGCTICPLFFKNGIAFFLNCIIPK